MVKSETSKCGIGIKIAFSDLINNLSNDNLCIFFDGFINDNNSTFNENYNKLLFDLQDDKRNFFTCGTSIRFSNDTALQQVKDYLIFESKKLGEIIRLNNDPLFAENSLRHGSIYEQDVLYITHHILSTERWGYDRAGINASFTETTQVENIINIIKESQDFAKSKFNLAEGTYQVVFIISQNSSW